MMNRKAAIGGIIQTILNSALIFGIMYFIIFVLIGAGGGFTTAFNIGKFIAKVPVWFWITISLFWLISQLRR